MMRKQLRKQDRQMANIDKPCSLAYARLRWRGVACRSYIGEEIRFLSSVTGDQLRRRKEMPSVARSPRSHNICVILFRDLVIRETRRRERNENWEQRALAIHVYILIQGVAGKRARSVSSDFCTVPKMSKQARNNETNAYVFYPISLHTLAYLVLFNLC